MFELEQVSKSFGGTRALPPLDLRVPAGRTTVLLGPSGCGKSTLLRLMNGLLRPDTGRVLFRGQPLRDEELLSVRQRIGYALQGGGLFPHLTVELPMAAPSILAGIQTSAVINVGTATLGARIGAGGYGQPILTGIRLDDTGLILQGAVPAAGLALLVSGLFELVERLVCR